MPYIVNIFIILLFFSTCAGAENLTITIFHTDIKPINIKQLPIKNIVIKTIDLNKLERLESYIENQLDMHHNAKTLLEKIHQLDKKILLSLSQAWSDHILARESGIQSADDLPATLFDNGKHQWLYTGFDVNEGYTKWLRQN